MTDNRISVTVPEHISLAKRYIITGCPFCFGSVDVHERNFKSSESHIGIYNIGKVYEYYFCISVANVLDY